jgi:hypothetical protein
MANDAASIQINDLYTHLRSLFIASLLIWSFACDLSADTPPIRVSVQADCRDCDTAQMLSALSHEFRKLDGVSVTDKQPALKVDCITIQIHAEGVKLVGYAASVALTNIDDQIIGHLVLTQPDIDRLAHEIAVTVDGGAIEQMRRAAQPSKTP